LRALWRQGGVSSTSYDRLDDFLPGETLAALDLFDRLKLNAVIEVGRGAKSLSDAGHRLAASSRASRTSTNNADRLRKYLTRFQ
jgi:transcriptional regulatory protein RtcR